MFDVQCFSPFPDSRLLIPGQRKKRKMTFRSLTGTSHLTAGLSLTSHSDPSFFLVPQTGCVCEREFGFPAAGFRNPNRS